MQKNNSIVFLEVINTIFILIWGAILHFTYDFTNSNPIVGIFSAVNESTWEHLKLVYFPMIISIIIGNLYTNGRVPNYICAKTKAIILAMSFVVVFFYTYTGIIGKNFAFLDIGSFFVAVILGQLYAYKLIKKESRCNNTLAIAILIIIFICFFIFTFNPPRIKIFMDPITGKYGI